MCMCKVYSCIYYIMWVCEWIYIFISQSVTISCYCTDIDTLAEFIDNFSWFFLTFISSFLSLFSPLSALLCAQQVTNGKRSWWCSWQWWWSCWRGESNCWQQQQSASLQRISKIQIVEAHFRLAAYLTPWTKRNGERRNVVRYLRWALVALLFITRHLLLAALCALRSAAALCRRSLPPSLQLSSCYQFCRGARSRRAAKYWSKVNEINGISERRPRRIEQRQQRNINIYK